MGTSGFPSPVSPASLSLPHLLDDWFTTTDPDRLFAQALTRSSTSGSPSSSSSSSLDCPERRAFLHSDGLHLQASSQVVSPVISSNSAFKEKPKSPLDTMPNTNAMESSAAQYFQASQVLEFNQLGNTTVKPRTPSCISSIVTSAVSAPASAGPGVTKVSKRRARINKKAPIAVLSADTSNFRAMVQQLTGIPPSHVSPMWGTSGAVPLLRPQPTRFAYNGSLPTLDTSTSFLGPKQILPFLQRAQQPLIDGLLCGEVSNNAAENDSVQDRDNIMNYDALSSSLTSLPDLWDAVGSGTARGNHMRGNLEEISASNLVRECEQAFPRHTLNVFESLLMSDDDVYVNLPVNAVDSWLAFDGGVMTSPPPRVDLAELAS